MMRLKKRLIWIWLSFVFVPILAVLAQVHPPPPVGPPRDAEEREKIRENIENFRMWKLLEALDLTEEQSTQFLPALKDFQNAKRRFEDKRKELLRELEVALESKNDEKKLKETLDALENTRKVFQTEMETFLDEAEATLSLEQQARLHLFQEKFERRLRETIRQIRGKGPRWKGLE